MIQKRLISFTVLFVLIITTISTKAAVVDSAKIYLNKNWPVEKKINYAYAYCLSVADDEGDYALKYGRRLHELSKTTNDSLLIGKSLYLIGYAFSAKENFIASIDYLFRTLRMVRPATNNTIVINSYNVIGICYSKQGQHKKAAEYFSKVVENAQKENSNRQMAIAYNNLAIEYQNQKQYTLADKYLKNSYLNLLKSEMYDYVATVYSNRGVIRFYKGMYDSALVYYREALAMHYKYSKTPMPTSLSNNLGEVFFKLNELDSSLAYLKYSLLNTDTLNDKYSIRELFKHLSNVYYAKNNLPLAYYYLKKHTQVNENIFNDENLKKSINLEANFNFIKKENELKLSEEKRAYEKKRNGMFYLFGSITGVLLVLALIIAIFRFREKKKANILLIQQKNKIQEQAKEITDSINYAKRIQDSILPSKDLMNKVLNKHLLIYIPRDIVGGDFYYTEQVGDRKYFAVIDCTGHGVPGGFMSILGYNGLQNAILDLKLKHPNEILDSLSKNLVTHFTQEGKQTLRDGMDMALCCVYEKEGKQVLEFSGANNPCWIVKQKSNELIELKANKQPIGYFENYKPFTNHVLELEKGDSIYLFSDGYADQFGGLSGKKFKYSQLKSLILHTPLLSVKEKEDVLKSSFLDWKGNYEQLDDVCVLAVQL